jgi:hypothetical protein
MLSVIISTAGEERPAVATLAALVPGAAAGIISEVTLVDRPGGEVIERVADVAGCHFMAFDGSRAGALSAGATQTKAPWLLFLQAGAVLDAGWIDEAAQFIRMVSDGDKARAGIFRYARSPYADAGWRNTLAALARAITGPHADEGLLIAREHYDRLGGHDAGRSESRLLRRLGSAKAQLRSRLVRI